MNLDGNSLEAVTLFTLHNDELVLINIDGDLDQMIEFAMQPAHGHRGVVKSG